MVVGLLQKVLTVLHFVGGSSSCVLNNCQSFWQVIHFIAGQPSQWCHLTARLTKQSLCKRSYHVSPSQRRFIDAEHCIRSSFFVVCRFRCASTKTAWSFLDI
uniref:Secreted protein n=1 Tax=Ixodes ricinus TaxID=34613 RepID=A0A6B0UHD2_IXORI